MKYHHSNFDWRKPDIWSQELWCSLENKWLINHLCYLYRNCTTTSVFNFNFVSQQYRKICHDKPQSDRHNCIWDSVWNVYSRWLSACIARSLGVCVLLVRTSITQLFLKLHVSGWGSIVIDHTGPGFSSWLHWFTSVIDFLVFMELVDLPMIGSLLAPWTYFSNLLLQQ